ncbi:hypothetical protein A7P53_10140 [Acinetobacter defluvii]|uniref:hypothetical protein n=1 Tax=Acinetobacter defluvii TaxID=1871111 RepID=UPI00148FA58D|nr:hypothetical protein [Acinetobacter defluvii]NNP72930.1 hypothetical protein [Acinetobacter defluvii]
MTNNKVGLKLSAIAISVLLASCGGGGSDGYYGGGADGTTTPPDGSGSVGTQTIKISKVELYDLNNKLTQTITSAGATAKVKVTDGSGKGISGALVTFTGEGVAFGTTNGAVLTNIDGEASISLKPTDSSDTGSYQLTATALYHEVTASTSPYYYSLQAANISLENMLAATNELETGASTNITLKTQDAISKANQNNISVNFTATCGSFDNSTVVSSNQGDVTTTYKAIDANGNLCEGKQTITASNTSNSTSKSVVINIASIQANSIVYTSGDVNLGIQKSGSASTGQVEFTIYANGKPAANQEVNVELLRAPEDLSFISLGNRTVKTIKSDSTGKLTVTIYPGNKPGPVELKATLKSNTSIFALSKEVKVSTGRLTQNGLSLSVSKNSLQNKIDGDTATITARMVDRVGNPVPDGTVISFVAEGGAITPNCASKDGSCTVTLTTQNPRPADNRVTVLAYAEGDKAFIDKDGDNLYNAAVDSLASNIGDFFRDDNEDNIYNSVAGEFIYKRGATGIACAASTIYQPNIASTCDNNLDGVIRQQLLFAFATETPTLTSFALSSTSLSFKVFGNSQLSVPMPSGTTVKVTANDNTKNNEKSCSVDILSGDATVANVFDLLTPTTFKNSSQTYYAYKLKECEKGDSFKIEITSPNGKISSYEPAL